MSPIVLPANRAVKVDKPRMMNFGGPLKPSMGGPVINIQRLGTRHAIDVTIPLMNAEPDGRIWAAALRLGMLYGVIFPFFQDGLHIGDPGTPHVAGAGQTGTTLNLAGFVGGYHIRVGQAFSVIVQGRRYLYFAATDTTVAGDGTVSLPIFPMIRKSPGDGDIAEFKIPIIQGSLSGNEISWTRMTANVVDFGTISISEDE